MVTYTGIRDVADNDDFKVLVNRDGQTYFLNPRLDIVNHSPTGISWGYAGSGPAQCALGILADYLRDSARAQQFYQDFKWKIISRFPIDEGWVLTDKQIEEFFAALPNQNG